MCMADMHEYGDELGDLDVIVYSVTLRVTYSPSFFVFFLSCYLVFRLHLSNRLPQDIQCSILKLCVLFVSVSAAL